LLRRGEGALPSRTHVGSPDLKPTRSVAISFTG
jgi:hypothetical protein